MRPLILAVAVAAFLVGLTGGAASANNRTICVGRDHLVRHLAREYGEAVTAAGVDRSGNLVQVFSNSETGTFTIAVTIPGGPTCILIAGEGWVREQTAKLPPDEEGL